MLVDDPEDLHRRFAERANAGDLDGLIALYEDGAAFVGPDGTNAAGSDAIRDRLEALLAMAPQITPTSSRAVMAGDVALLSNRFHMTFGPSDGERAGLDGTSTEVARRQPDGSWLYVIDDPASSTVLPGTSVATAGDPTAFEQLRYQEDGSVLRITLDRPERHNALSMQLSEELASALELARRSRTVKVVIIQGAGETFCAGDDITEMGQWGNANEIVRRVRGYQRMADTLADLDKVTIAAVDGFAVGGGLEITMACDFVVATHRAKWGMPEVDVGITPGWGGTTRMARLIGRRMTKEINLLVLCTPRAARSSCGCGTVSWRRTAWERRSTPSCKCCSPRTSRQCVS